MNLYQITSVIKRRIALNGASSGMWSNIAMREKKSNPPNKADKAIVYKICSSKAFFWASISWGVISTFNFWLFSCIGISAGSMVSATSE